MHTAGSSVQAAPCQIIISYHVTMLQHGTCPGLHSMGLGRQTCACHVHGTHTWRAACRGRTEVVQLELASRFSRSGFKPLRTRLTGRHAGGLKHQLAGQQQDLLACGAAIMATPLRTASCQ